jgi:hypothetical protein
VRLTVEEDRETIKRYAHIKPGRPGKLGLCSARCPGTARTCTLAKRHRGPHVAHGSFRRVLAVWDADTEARRSSESARPALVPRARGEVWTGGMGEVVEALRSRIAHFTPSLAEVAMLILLLGFVAFAIEWLLLIFG